MIKYISIKKSSNINKKFVAIFYYQDKKKVKSVNFESAGASDYTIHKDYKRKQLYLDRHQAREDWNDFITAGSLSRLILWHNFFLELSLRDYLNKFNLKKV